MTTTVKKARRVTVSLPAELIEAADRAGARERRSRSDVVREALRWYLRVQELPWEDATPEEIEAIEEGRAQIARGEFVTHEDIKHELETALRKAGAKKPKNVPA